MVLLFSSTPSHADIKSFMDDAEREYWDTQQGTPEERVAFCKSLEDLWRTIPDPTEAELEQVMGPLDWGHVQRGENREDILGFYRRKWKKDRKAAAEAHKQNHQSSLPEPETKKRKGVRISDLIKASKDNPPAGDYKPGDASELFKKAEENPDASKPDLTSLNDSFRKLGERMQKDREESAQRLADSLRELVFQDPQTGRTSIRHDPIRDDEYPLSLESVAPTAADKPWHKSRDLVVGLVATGMVTVMGIVLVIAPPTNPQTVRLWLAIIFLIFSFSLGLVIHYFWHSRLAIVAGILASAVLTSGVGWYVQPPTPPLDWRRSDEAKQLGSQMASDVQKLEDEGRLIDLTDYHRAIKVYADWAEKCSVTLGRIDNQMRQFKRETTYRYYFEKSDSDVRKPLSDKNEDRKFLGGVIRIKVLALQAVEKALAVDTSPDLDPNYPNLLSH